MAEPNKNRRTSSGEAPASGLDRDTIPFLYQVLSHSRHCQAEDPLSESHNSHSQEILKRSPPVTANESLHLDFRQVVEGEEAPDNRSPHECEDHKPSIC